DLKHQGFPFHFLNHLIPKRCGSDGLYDVIVNFQRNDYGFSLGGAPITCFPHSVGFAAPWSITAFEHGADFPLHIVIGYDPGRVSSEEATRLLRCFHELLLGAPSAGEIAIGRLPIVSAEERAALLRRGQGERLVLPEAETLTTLVASQTARSPDATALV